MTAENRLQSPQRWFHQTTDMIAALDLTRLATRFLDRANRSVARGEKSVRSCSTQRNKVLCDDAGWDIPPFLAQRREPTGLLLLAASLLAIAARRRKQIRIGAIQARITHTPGDVSDRVV